MTPQHLICVPASMESPQTEGHTLQLCLHLYSYPEKYHLHFFFPLGLPLSTLSVFG